MPRSTETAWVVDDRLRMESRMEFWILFLAEQTQQANLLLKIAPSAVRPNGVNHPAEP